MGAEGTGVAKETVGPIGIGIELVMVERTSELDVTEPEANMDKFSKMSSGDD